MPLASLLKEFKGRIEPIYIDPPFDAGGLPIACQDSEKWYDSGGLFNQ